MRIDVVEIDPVVSELAERYFAYGRHDYPNIRVMHDDARVHVRDSDERYDLIYLDVYDHLLTVPWTMVTVEALRLMADHLEPDGLFVANVLSPRTGPGVAFLQRLRATLDEVFPESRVYVSDPTEAPGVTQNLIIINNQNFAHYRRCRP